jgi:hypothetical protein
MEMLLEEVRSFATILRFAQLADEIARCPPRLIAHCRCRAMAFFMHGVLRARRMTRGGAAGSLKNAAPPPRIADGPASVTMRRRITRRSPRPYPARRGRRTDDSAGPAGIGDTMATCYSPLSRTGDAASRLRAACLSPKRSHRPVASRASGDRRRARARARHGIDMPIAEALRAILFDGAKPTDVIRTLLEREATRES